MKKVLLTATVQSHIAQFHKPLIAMLHENGYEVHAAARNNLVEKNGLQLDTPDKVFDIPFQRSPFDKRNIAAYRQLKQIMAEEDYDIIHCNTPVGGILTRMAAKPYRKKGARVLYTAHGFHFYKGASKKNWLVYYPLEKSMARLTDDLITITREDYQLATAKRFNTKVRHVHGVGVNNGKYRILPEAERKALREEQHCDDKFVLLCTGELNANKNQTTVIKAMPAILAKHPDTLLWLAGNGPMHDELENLIVSMGLQEQIKMLGYRTDLEKYVNMSDLIISASFREGLPLNIMEAMICGKAVVASNNRGHRELVAEGETGYLIDPADSAEFADKVNELIEDDALRERFGQQGIRNVVPYDVVNVVEELKEIYLPGR